MDKRDAIEIAREYIKVISGNYKVSEVILFGYLPKELTMREATLILPL